MEDNRTDKELYLDEVRERAAGSLWKRDNLRVSIEARGGVALFDDITAGFGLSKKEIAAAKKKQAPAKISSRKRRKFTEGNKNYVAGILSEQHHGTTCDNPFLSGSSTVCGWRRQ